MVFLKSLALVVRRSSAVRCSAKMGVDLQSSFAEGSRARALHCAGRPWISPSLYTMQKLSRPATQFLLPSSRSLVSQRSAQTKSDVEMSDFLRDEIQAEKESLKATGKAVQVKGFDVTTNEAEVTLKKSFQGEQISISTNVNHAVDAEPGSEMDRKPEDTPDMTKMVCRPNFSVEIQKGPYTLAFNCSLVREDGAEDEDMPRTSEDGQNYQDLFNIDEFSIYKGAFKDSTYVMAGEVMDGNFYDNLMNMLDERGVNTDFVKELTDFCTLYEQKLYVNLLEHLQDIVKSAAN